MSSLWTPTAGQRPTAAEWKDRVADRVLVACTSSTRPGTPVDGQFIWETDTDVIAVHNGTSWVVVARLAEASYTPTWTNIATPGTTNAGKYDEAGGMVFVRVNGTWASGTTPSNTPVTFSLPKPAASSALGNFCVGNFVWRNSGGAYAVADAVFLPSTTTCALMTSSFAYTPNTGHSVLEIYGMVAYRAA